jgi:membrane protein required for colicin V production
MNLLDIVIICVMVLLIVKGLLRGFIRETASLAGVVLGILLGHHFQPELSAHLKSYLPQTSLLPVISFSVIFGFVLISCNLLGYLVKLVFEKSFLGWLDRTLGLGLAVTKGVILTYLGIVLLTFFVPAKTPLIARSKLAPWIVVSYQSMVRLISPEHYERWKMTLLGEIPPGGRIVSEGVEEIVKNK